jgi:hypothetical protein
MPHCRVAVSNSPKAGFMASRRPSNLSYAEGLIAWHRKTIWNDRENRRPAGRRYERFDEDPGILSE